MSKVGIMATTDQHANIITTGTTAAEEQQEREVARKLAERYRYAFIDLREQRINPELIRTISADLMFRYNFVPLETHNNLLTIAAADPGLVQSSDELPLLLGKKLLIRVATARQIADVLKRTEQSQRVLEQATEAFALQAPKEEEESEETISGDRLTRDSTASPVVRLVETVIFTALERRASDIHIEARDTEVAVKYRIDGVLQHAMQPIAKEHHSSVLSRIKVLSELDIAERRVPQDGRFRVKYKGRFIDLRVSIMPASHGEDAVLRVLDKETLSEKFANLTLDVVGFSPEELYRLRRYIHEPYGMVLVTGPTGSGKTTTLYAAINEIKSDEDKFITIEDPVEYQVRVITQIPVNEKKGLTFARGLRSGDSSNRDPIGAHGTPGVYYRSRQQRDGCDRPFRQYGRRAVQLCLCIKLHHGATLGARDLPELQASQALHAGRFERSRPRSGRVGKRDIGRRCWMFGVLGHGIPRADGDLRIDGPERSHPRNDCGPAPDFRSQTSCAGRRNGYASRERAG